MNKTCITDVLQLGVRLCSRILWNSVSLLKRDSLSLRCYATAVTALHVPGDKANTQPFIVQPNLDFQSTLTDTNLQKNLKLRGLHVDISALIGQWESYLATIRMLDSLEVEKNAIVGKINAYHNKNVEVNELSSNEVEVLKVQGRQLRHKKKETMKTLYKLENELIPQLLQLPNKIHPKCPTLNKLEVTLHCANRPRFAFPAVSYHQIIERTNSVLFSPVSPTGYYLCGDSAELEQDLVDSVIKILQEKNFVHLCCPDTFKSAIVEGCSVDWTSPDRVITLESDKTVDTENRLHLVGMSPMSFSAFLTRMVVRRKNLPMKLFSAGRQYEATNLLGHFNSDLLHAVQSTDIGVFGATEDLQACVKLFDEFIEVYTEIYKSLKLPFQIALVPCEELSPAEMLRSTLQVYLPGSESYVDAGHLSLYGDYVSKRLTMRYDSGAKEKCYLHTLHGTLLSFPRILACIMENYQREDHSFSY